MMKMKDNMTLEEKKRFITRYETMSKQQANMTGDVFDDAEKWLGENEDKYLSCLK